MPDSRFILDTTPPLTAKQLFGAPEVRPADQSPEEAESLWTLQQFSEVNGKPWLALREYNLDGSIQHQYTGTAEEIAALTAANNISPRPLPAVTEEHFYSQLLSSDRDYELGRQFAADPAQGIPHHLAPMDLNRFSVGMTDRVLEQQIRTENQTQLQPAPQQITQASAQIETQNGERHTLNEISRPREKQQQSYEESAEQSFGMAV
jgi:hypothetical protein